MRRSLRPLSLIVATATLLLFTACASKPAADKLPAPALNSVTPGSIANDGTESVTFHGTGIFQVIQGDGFTGELTATICGVGLTDLQVTGQQRSVRLASGQTVTIRAGDTLTGQVPAFTHSGPSTATLTLPDGQSATLEQAAECYDPTPLIAGFTHDPAETAPGEEITFTWTVSSPAMLGISCTLDPGDGSGETDFSDCPPAGSATHTYTAAGTYTATLSVTDAQGRDVTASTIVPVMAAGNNPPTAEPQDVSLAQDAALAITLTGTDPDGDTLTYSITDGPENGSLSGTPPDVTYTPDPGWHGTDSFTFQVDDGRGATAQAEVTITVEPLATVQVSITPHDNPYLQPADTHQFEATVVADPGADTSVNWNSSDPGVATIGPSGLMTVQWQIAVVGNASLRIG